MRTCTHGRGEGSIVARLRRSFYLLYCMNNKKLTNLISNNYKILVKILVLFFDSIKVFLIVPQYFTLLNSLIEKNGLSYTVKYMKQARLHITRYMCGSPLLVNSAGVSVDKTG